MYSSVDTWVKMAVLVALWFCSHSEWENETKHCLLTQTESVLQETRTPQACVCQAPSSSNQMPSRHSRGAPLEIEFGYWDNQWIFFQSNKSDEKLLPGAQEPVLCLGDGGGGRRMVPLTENNQPKPSLLFIFLHESLINSFCRKLSEPS